MGGEIMTSIDESGNNTVLAAPTAATTTNGPPPLRSRRKSAKAAAAFVAAAVKEEMLIPDHPSPGSMKRTYSRGNSQGSSASAATAHGGSAHGGGSSSSGGRSASRSNSSSSSGGGHSKKKTALSSHAVEYLKNWMMSPDHIEHPYPTEDEKVRIMKETGIELKQLTNWFVNNRKRYWKPKVEELRRQSTDCNVTLQEIAAAQQRQREAAPKQRAPSSGGGVAASARKGSSVDRSVVVSSEGEESVGSTQMQQQQRRGSGASSSSPSKKRKKYSILADKASAVAAAAKNAKKVKETSLVMVDPTHRRQQQPQSQQQLVVANPIASDLGIHTATTHETVKASRKMSRIISEHSSSESEEEDHHGGAPHSSIVLSSVGVSNPLANAVATSSAPLPVAAAPAVAPGSIQMQQRGGKQLPRIQQTVAADSTNLVDDLDFSISPLDTQVVANTAAGNAATVTAAAAGFTCSAMPHSCNLADPLGSKNRFAQPCALCSACRDWNLGEFCPWDLTGIIGDISTDVEITQSSSSSETTKEGASCEEATTITKTSMVEVADVASIDGNEEVDVSPSSTTTAPQMSSRSSFLIPKEITHSTSAADFISSMVDIETWG
mmetsp:Transcript_27531/g.46863  ORF Transcript_27531/g.46863 Transcript_27531/m.46863 type:complete len:607 (+) Transcript_27531:348-2168(+)